MNRRAKLHAARKRVDRDAMLTLARHMVIDGATCRAIERLVRRALRAGYDAAKPDVCARCGAEIARGE